MKKFLLIDGSNVMFRAYFATAAMNENLMRNHKGFPTNMVYGFINIYTKIINNGYTHVAVAFDKGKKTRRHLMFEDYKAGRQKTPQELLDQIPYLHKFLDAMNIKHFWSFDYEADDIVASLSKKFYSDFDEIDVLSNDNDLFQLIRPKVFQVYTEKKEQVLFDEEMLMEKKGVRPSQIPDFKALIGDKSDNLPGVEGIGPVIASKLLSKYETLGGIYEHIDEITGKTNERLTACKDTAFFTKDMATLDPSFSFEESEDDFAIKEPNYKELVELYEELDFQSFLRKIPKNTIKREFKYEIKDDPFSLEEIIDKENINYLVLDVLGEYYHTAPQIGFGLTNSKGTFYIPYETAISSFDFQYFLGDELIKKAVYDYKQMYSSLLKDDIHLSGVTFDLLLGAYLISPELTKNGFSAMASHFGYKEVEYDEDVYGKKGREQLPFEDVYASHIAKKSFAISLVFDEVMKEIKENGQEWLFSEVEIPLSKTLAKMEYQGLRVDPTVLSEYHENLEKELNELEDQIHNLAGHTFNIQSPKQLGTILFEEMGLPYNGKKKESGYQTDSSTLETIQNIHPIIELILKYRSVSKLLQTYVVGVENAIQEKKDNHIHTIYKQAWTDTGRLSSIEPNLQNLPYRDEETKKFRRVFIAEDGCYLMSSDYSQIELRVLAHLAKENHLINAFNNGEDIHEATAKAVYGKDSVTKEERRSAKAVNFGIVYGISDFGLSNDLGISISEAKAFIKKYHESFPMIEPYTQSLIRNAEKDGYVSTMFNRRRYIRDIHASNYNMRNFAMRTAMNAPIQGTAADILKIAMVKLDKAIEESHLHAKLILTIHDEVVLNVPIEEIEETKKLTESIMDSAVKLDVPLLVDSEYGINLYEAK